MMPLLKEEREVVDSLQFNKDTPHIIKYMGSKKELLGFITTSINEIYNGEPICDLFAGTGIVGGSIGHNAHIYSNDIQEYSAVLAKTYLGDFNWKDYPDLLDEIIRVARLHVQSVMRLYPDLVFDYEGLDLNQFNAIEQLQQDLINYKFEDVEHHLFIKNYSGTYWSFKQCLWIDALRVAANTYANSEVYYPILSSIMFAMAYNAQSTGHFAQYRDANNVASMEDIIRYRNRSILKYFKKKFNELINSLGRSQYNHNITSLDYVDCLDRLPERMLVYADPPYSFVHYSRFYHALETLVRYDYPEVLYKGRYRTDRHQSPFCKRTTVNDAFQVLFEKIKEKRHKLLLSYSNTGMISLEEVLTLASAIMGDEYYVYTKDVDYSHSTMGRLEDKSREVKEYLVIAIPVQK